MSGKPIKIVHFMGVINMRTNGGESLMSHTHATKNTHREQQSYRRITADIFKTASNGEVTKPTRIAFIVQFVAYHTIVIQDESATKEKLCGKYTIIANQRDDMFITMNTHTHTHSVQILDSAMSQRNA